MDDGMTECECTNRKLNSMIFCFFFVFVSISIFFLSIFSFFLIQCINLYYGEIGIID